MTASQTIIEPPTARDPDIIGERERELSKQLAIILKRAPKRPHAKTKQELAVSLGRALDHQVPADPAGNDIENHPVDDNTPPPLDNAKSTKHPPGGPANSEEPEAEGPPPDFNGTTLVRTARRARLRKGVRQAGAWMITFSVTAFIIGCVSIMLLGLPATLNPATWISATALEPADSTPADKSNQPGRQTPPR